MINQKLIDNFETNVDYTTVLNNFEGPLDLLLFLINRAQIEVKDIFVSQVTEQFISYLQGLEYIDIEKTADYLAIAATITEIKSRKLLPEPEVIEPEDDPEHQLKMRLEEYRLYKEAGEKLKTIEDVDKFYKEPDDSVGVTKIVYTDFNLDGLIKAFTELLLKADRRTKSDMLEKEIPKEIFTVSEKILYIRERLVKEDEVQFFSLFTKYSTRNEIVTTFQAILELLKLQAMSLKQNELFGEIVLKNKQGGELIE